MRLNGVNSSIQGKISLAFTANDKTEKKIKF
jgi:hypothetical protein